MAVVRLFGGLRREAGTSTVMVRGDTVRAALDALCANNVGLRAVFWDNDALHDHVRVMVNGV
jgi:molybdopterin converting factor small subunit